MHYTDIVGNLLFEFILYPAGDEHNSNPIYSLQLHFMRMH